MPESPLSVEINQAFQDHDVIPAKAGIQFLPSTVGRGPNWIPAFAGMTP
jgi:hypothetical protein